MQWFVRMYLMGRVAATHFADTLQLLLELREHRLREDKARIEESSGRREEHDNVGAERS